MGAPRSSALAPPGGPAALPDLQLRHLSRARRRRFLALMVDAPGSSALAPPRGPPSTFLSVDGGRSQISSSATSQGGPAALLDLQLQHLPGAHCRCFLPLIVDAPGSLAPAPKRGGTTLPDHQLRHLPGVRHWRFLALMVDAPRSSALAPPEGPLSMFLSVDGGCSRISSSGTS
jgi:hypothetical protein